jgi:hypothetical protein
MHQTNAKPRLLVSVRDGDEALEAIRGGCEILDIKEPSRGSLGMADVDIIAQVAAISRQRSPQLGLSAALGETTDWIQEASVPALPPELDYVKLGPAGLGRCSDWRHIWENVRHRFDSAAMTPLRWIAVAYADWQQAHAPPPYEIVEAASGCAGVLIDTWKKDGRHLFDWMSADELRQLAVAGGHASNKLFAIAGSLQAESFLSLREVGADIVAVRTAACSRGERCGRISELAVRSLRAELKNCFAATSAK